MKKLIFTLIIAFAISISTVSAQTGYVAFQYGISFSTGEQADYVSSPSFRGFLFEYKYAFSEKLYGGIDLGWYMFYEDTGFDTWTINTETISGYQYRYNQDVPFLLSVEYMFRPEQTINPYVNFGLGGLYARRKTEMGVFYTLQDSWQFVIKPEVGVLFNVSSQGAVKFSVKYYNGFDSGDLDAQTFVSLGVGYVVLF